MPSEGGLRPSLTIGVLALQGAFAAHQRMLEGLGASTIAVRQPKHLDGVDALVIPGGESTTMSKLAVSTGLFQPISERLAAGMPAFGTCAGAIMLATHIASGRADQRDFETLDSDGRRNVYGRQIDSVERLLGIWTRGVIALDHQKFAVGKGDGVADFVDRGQADWIEILPDGCTGGRCKRQAPG